MLKLVTCTMDVVQYKISLRYPLKIFRLIDKLNILGLEFYEKLAWFVCWDDYKFEIQRQHWRTLWTIKNVLINVSPRCREWLCWDFGHFVNHTVCVVTWDVLKGFQNVLNLRSCKCNKFQNICHNDYIPTNLMPCELCFWTYFLIYRMLMSFSW